LGFNVKIHGKYRRGQKLLNTGRLAAINFVFLPS
jgi:hypothetical protein